MSKTEQQEWSRNMAIAVMVGKNIYNIGELVRYKSNLSLRRKYSDLFSTLLRHGYSSL